MDTLEAFLKTALYRVVFVLIVGIPAVEVFSHAFFSNGIVIQKIDNETIPAKITWRLNGFQPDMESKIPGTLEIPTEYFPHQKGILTIEIPEADLQFQYDPELVIQNKDIIQVGNSKFTFRDLSTMGWVFYLTIAWILGEILCFLGETLIGAVFFDYKPFHPYRVERVNPFLSSTWIQIKDFIKASQRDNALALEISEVHFVLSRVFSGLIFLVPFFIYVLLNILNLPVWLLIGLYILLIVVNLILLGKFCSLLQNVEKKLLCIVLLFLPTSIVILYRTHANRLLKAAADNNSQTERTGEQ